MSIPGMVGHEAVALADATALWRVSGVSRSYPLHGQLYGPGLPRTSDLLDQDAVTRIRAGVANPVLAAGIAAALLTELPTQTLHSLPWQALAAGEGVPVRTGPGTPLSRSVC